MALRIDAEPRPLVGAQLGAPAWPDADTIYRLDPPKAFPQRDLLDILRSRRSRSGGQAHIDLIGTILHYSTELREKRKDGRFGYWESRTSPSAGGIHGVRICLIPITSTKPLGLYLPDEHALASVNEPALVRKEAVRLLDDLQLSHAGYLLQLVANVRSYAERYENSETLLLRDAGALCMTITLVAKAVGASSRVLGHLDRGIVSAMSLGPDYAGVGGVHITARGA